MLFTRGMGSDRVLSLFRKGISRSYTDYGRIIFVASGVFFIGIAGSLLPTFLTLKNLEEDQRVWSEVVAQASNEEELEQHRNAEELPTIIEQCVDIFQKENIAVQRFNLERFGDEKSSPYPYLNFALVRLNLKGSWEGIHNGLIQVEALVNQGIRVQEVHLNPFGGEILLRIYFQEPDNPSTP